MKQPRLKYTCRTRLELRVTLNQGLATYYIRNPKEQK